MIKKFVAIAGLSLPLFALAGVNVAAPVAAVADHVKGAEHAASAVPAVPAQSTPAEERLRVVKRGMNMGVCQQKAAEQQLDSMERKVFIGKCLKGL